MRKSSSSKANGVRTAWFFVIVIVENGLNEVHVCKRSVDGSVNRSKAPCEFKRTTNTKKVESDYLVLQIKTLQKMLFKIEEMTLDTE